MIILNFIKEGEKRRTENDASLPRKLSMFASDYFSKELMKFIKIFKPNKPKNFFLHEF